MTNTSSGLLSNVLTGAFTYQSNIAPVLSPIGPQTGNENTLLTFGVSAIDADSTTPTLNTSALPNGATFTDNMNGTGTFDWTPDFTQAGVYNITFFATDGIDTDSEQVAITINSTNQPPVLAAIGPQTGSENILLTFGVSAIDADSTTPTMTSSTLPNGAIFTDNSDGTGTFNWTPTFTQAGSYDVAFYASDGVDTDSEQVVITINGTSQPPVLASIGPKTGSENSLLTFGVSATDADGTTPALSTSTLPNGAVFNDNFDGTGTFNWTPNFNQAGSYNVKFFASDGVDTDSEQVVITIGETNQPPVLATIGPQSGSESTLLTFGVSATDADNTTPILSTPALPSGATFADNGDGTGIFDWTPASNQVGMHSITFIASDGTLDDSETVQLTVNSAANRPPVLTAIGPQLVAADSTMIINLSATDPDLTIPVLLAFGVPPAASFVDFNDTYSECEKGTLAS